MAAASPYEAGSAARRSRPVPVSSTHRQVTGSSPPWLRRKATRPPSGEIWNERGTPRLNAWVLACCRGKLSVMAPILPAGAPVGLPPVSADNRRLLLVHAHPDDESIETGATMAAYATQGAHVTLVTCTRGELGEVIPPELADLAAGPGDRLGEHRAG